MSRFLLDRGFHQRREDDRPQDALEPGGRGHAHRAPQSGPALRRRECEITGDDGPLGVQGVEGEAFARLVGRDRHVVQVCLALVRHPAPRVIRGAHAHGVSVRVSKYL